MCSFVLAPLMSYACETHPCGGGSVRFLLLNSILPLYAFITPYLALLHWWVFLVMMNKAAGEPAGTSLPPPVQPLSLQAIHSAVLFEHHEGGIAFTPISSPSPASHLSLQYPLPQKNANLLDPLCLNFFFSFFPSTPPCSLLWRLP